MGRALCKALERRRRGAAAEDVQARPLGSPEGDGVADAARAVADDERTTAGGECEDEHRALRRVRAAAADVVDVDAYVVVTRRRVRVRAGDNVVAAATAHGSTRRR